MAALTSRLLYLAALAASATIALRPSGALEQGLTVGLAPLRLLSEICAPVGLLRARSVRAAERTAGQLRAELDDERRALGADQRRFVLPQSESLRADRSFSIAEVVRRVAKDADRLEVRVFPGPDGRRPELAIGQPVVVGDLYIGRLHDVAPSGTGAVVELITRRDVFVGARVETPEGPARLVVGGLERDRSTRVRTTWPLAVHNPSRPDLARGRVVIDESLAGDVPFAKEAGGFELGELYVLDDSRNERRLAVRSPINLFAGIFQMAIVGTARGAAGSDLPETLDPLDDPDWIATRALSCGDPLAGHEGMKLAAGTTRGVRAGAAVVAGALLVGRVERASLFSADARLLGEPGLALPVVARIAGQEKPLILGTLVGLGPAPKSPEGRARVRFHWEGEMQLAGAAVPPESLAARLYTGAGAEGVPPGLILGDTRIARGAGRQVLEVTLEVDPRVLNRVRVRLSGDDAGSSQEPSQ